jgi:5-methyltetrahydropteroyltriglutamate--homocysteine methyltransferase
MIASNLGCPRIGRARELKTALEQYWAGQIPEAALREVGRGIRRESWSLQVELGIEHVPSNDFSLYDHVLDMATVVGAVPSRFAPGPGVAPDLAVYFAMARGASSGPGAERPVPAPLRMTKWFDTNYHFLVPELEPDTVFGLASTKPIDEFLEAKALGIHTRPVLLGPVSFALLSRIDRAGTDADPVAGVVDRLVPVYADLLERLERAGADWVQMDEPGLALELAPTVLRALVHAYERLGRRSARPRLLLASYFGGLGDNLETVLRLPVGALHLDLVRAPETLAPAVAQAPPTLSLSLGVVDGRNVWRTDLEGALHLVETACERLGAERVLVAPSCSLLHCPIGSRCGAPGGRRTSTGPWTPSASPPAAPATAPRSTPTCATRTSTRSSTRSPAWMPTCCRSRAPAPAWPSSGRCGGAPTPTTSGPACTTSMPRTSPARARSRRACRPLSRSCRSSGSGSIPTAG